VRVNFILENKEGKMENKKYLIVLILRILESDTDSEHPITQVKLASDISAIYPCDRKTVGRNIKFLIKLGYPIVKTTRGFYMDKKQFTRDEVEYVLSAVRDCGADFGDKDELCRRLHDALTRKYKF
jgi:hypothetical protein